MGLFKFRHSGRRQRQDQEAAEEQIRQQQQQLRIFNENLNKFKNEEIENITKIIDKKIKDKQFLYENMSGYFNYIVRRNKRKLINGYKCSIERKYEKVPENEKYKILSDILDEFMELMKNYTKINVKGSIDCIETLSSMLSHNNNEELNNYDNYLKLSSYLAILNKDFSLKIETDKIKQFDEVFRFIVTDKEFSKYYFYNKQEQFIADEKAEYCKSNDIDRLLKELDNYHKEQVDIEKDKLNEFINALEEVKKTEIQKINVLVSQEQTKAQQIVNDNVNRINENLQKQIKQIKKDKLFSIINTGLTIASFGGAWYLNTVSSSALSVNIQRSLFVTGCGSLNNLVKGSHGAGVSGNFQLAGNKKMSTNYCTKDTDLNNNKVKDDKTMLEIEIKEEIINKKYNEVLEKVKSVSSKKETLIKYPMSSTNNYLNESLNRNTYKTIMINMGSVLYNEYIDTYKFICQLSGSKSKYLALKNEQENDNKIYTMTPVYKSNVGNVTRVLTREALDRVVPFLKEFHVLNKISSFVSSDKIKSLYNKTKSLYSKNEFSISDKQMEHIIQKHQAGTINLNKSTFYGDPKLKIKEITDYISKNNIKPIQVNGSDIYIVKMQNSGKSGLVNQFQNQNYVTIVTKQGTKNIISAYPSDGTPSKNELRSYYNDNLSLFQ